MTKARARAAAKKVKDKWRTKTWYQILAPPLFENKPVAETLSDKPDSLVGRVTEVSMHDITGDMRRSHIKLLFKIINVEGNKAHTQYIGHSLTSDYIRRLVRRRRSRIDGVFDINLRDGARLRVKPFATTEKRIQSSQKKAIRLLIKKTLEDQGSKKTLNEFILDMLDGRLGSDIYQNCKSIYPVKRIEINKTEVMQQPTIVIETKKPLKKEETEEKKESSEITPKPVPSEPSEQRIDITIQTGEPSKKEGAIESDQINAYSPRVKDETEKTEGLADKGKEEAKPAKRKTSKTKKEKKDKE